MKKLVSLGISLIFIISSLGVAYADSFKIEEVEVIERDIIELIFTRELDSSLTAVREFVLENTETMVEIEVLLSEVSFDDAKKLTLMLDSFLEEETDYTITVLDIKDVNGETIEAGIDSIFTFNTGILSIGNNNSNNGSSSAVDTNGNNDVDNDDTPAVDTNGNNNANNGNTSTGTSTDMSSENENNQSSENTMIPENEVHNNETYSEIVDDDNWLEALNSAAELDVNNSGMGGSTLSGNEMEYSILEHAENSESLPDTGPEIILLILLTLLLTGGVMYVKNYRVS